MTFEHDVVYISPDGKRYVAQQDKRQYGEIPSWTLMPVQTDEDMSSASLSRDLLEDMLFADHNRIIKIDFGSATVVVDTGWTAEDFRREWSTAAILV